MDLLLPGLRELPPEALLAFAQLGTDRVAPLRGLRDVPLEVWQVVAAGVELAEELAKVLADVIGVIRAHLKEVTHA
eukprot:13604403-Alexandrium_andersonii.AAC.1